jgi:peptide/nickel transport system substrate-binding protein
MDKQGIVEFLYGGDTTAADTFLNRTDRQFPDVDRAIAKYPYDPRRAEQLLGEIGLAKDRDGFFAAAAGTRFSPDFQVLQSTSYERTGQAMTDIWSKAGIDVQFSVLPNNLVRDNEVRQTFPGIATPGISSSNSLVFMRNLASSAIGMPANRWSGNNRGGWSNPEFDRLSDAFQATLDRAERDRIVVDAMWLASVEVPAIPVFYDFYVRPVVASALRGPSLDASSLATLFWNVNEWELRSM